MAAAVGRLRHHHQSSRVTVWPVVRAGFELGTVVFATWIFAGLAAAAFAFADAEAKTNPTKMATTAAIFRSRVEVTTSPYVAFEAMIEQKVSVTQQELMMP
jgi:hypothetical protein